MERAHLQEWVIGNPQILGSEAVVVTFEFASWATPGGQKEQDRLDVLALQTDGRLVVAELKRGVAPDTVAMQALKYAALASRFHVENLSAAHARFLTARGIPTTADEAYAALREFAPDLSDGTMTNPVVVLIASEFPALVVTTAHYLSRYGIEIRLNRFQAHRTPGGEIVVTVAQIFPIAEIDAMLLAPISKEERKAIETAKKDATTVSKLLNAGSMREGQTLIFRPERVRREEARAMVKTYLAGDPVRGQASWVGGAKPLAWGVDGIRYSPTGLAKRIIFEATGQKVRAVRGPALWGNEDGLSLVELAGGARANPDDQDEDELDEGDK
jgi:hypothetical protein